MYSGPQTDRKRNHNKAGAEMLISAILEASKELHQSI